MPPKPKDPEAEPKKRSRTGCSNCKLKKVKCGEEKPACDYCVKDGVACDYSIKLNWDGRKKNPKPQPVAWAAVPLQKLNTWGSADGVQGPVFQTSPQSAPGMSPPKSDTTSQTAGERSQMPVRGNYQASNASSHIQNADSRDQVVRSSYPTGFYMPGGNSYIPGGGSRTPAATAYIPTPSPTPTSSHRVSFGFGPVDNTANSAESASRPVDNTSKHVDSTPRPSPPRSTSYASVAQYIPQNDPLSARSVEHCPVVYTPSRSSPHHHPSKYQRVGSESSISNRRDSSYEADEASPSRLVAPTNRASNPMVATQNQQMPPPPRVTLPGIKSFDFAMADQPPAQTSTRSALDLSCLARLMSQGGSNISSDPRSRILGPSVIYGIDRGIRDLDLDLNDDANALAITLPDGAGSRRLLHEQIGLDREERFGGSFGFGVNSSPGTGQGAGSSATNTTAGYYSQEAIVHMPRQISNLPELLTSNDMNMLYFHHFMSHTASVMVPHDCDNNPFRSFLPKLALQDDHLLKIVLAYSACHRARYLRQKPPVKRIATYTSDVFRRLADDLQGPIGELNYIHLATTIMLASLKVIAPESFEGQMTWETPLAAAKEMILERGGWSQLRDETGHFLKTWFAYLDVVGSLTGSQYDTSKVVTTPTTNEQDADRFWQVDCLLGFTTRCIRILAKVAAICKRADKERIKDGRILHTWRPDVAMLVAADALKAQLENSTPKSSRLCQHAKNVSPEEASALAVEMLAVNDSFHWAGQIHLYKRVYGLRSDSNEVQMLVRNISRALHRVRSGSSAEHGMIFPMFTAGCEALAETQRQDILGRLHTVERSGMMQVGRARSLMVRVWETGMCWESLTSGEFLG